GPAPGLLVHRVLLQPPPQALQPRHAQPNRLRTATPTEGHRGLTRRCQRKRVNSKATSARTGCRFSTCRHRPKLSGATGSDQRPWSAPRAADAAFRFTSCYLLATAIRIRRRVDTPVRRSSAGFLALNNTTRWLVSARLAIVAGRNRTVT